MLTCTHEQLVTWMLYVVNHQHQDAGHDWKAWMSIKAMSAREAGKAVCDQSQATASIVTMLASKVRCVQGKSILARQACSQHHNNDNLLDTTQVFEPKRHEHAVTKAKSPQLATRSRARPEVSPVFLLGHRGVVYFLSAKSCCKCAINLICANSIGLAVLYQRNNLARKIPR